jgi:hypothetical protein
MQLAISKFVLSVLCTEMLVFCSLSGVRNLMMLAI